MKKTAAVQPVSTRSHATDGPTIRRLQPGDSIAEITNLLHRAYKPQVDMGLKPLAGRQDESVTRERAQHSECYVAVLDGRIVGVILFEEKEEADFPAHFLKPEVAHFSQFAVDPDVQGRGVGIALLDHVERRAREMNFAELALSMAEPDTGLMTFYLRRGFHPVEHWQWPYTNYRSAILSKPLTASRA